MKILIVSHFFPYPFCGGGGRRFQAFIKILQERHEITFVSFVDKKNEEDIDSLKNEWPRVEIITVPYPQNKSFNRLNRIKWLLNPWVRPITFSSKMKEVIKGLINTRLYDIVQFEYAQTGQYLPRTSVLRGAPPSILIEHDIISIAQLRRTRAVPGIKRKLFEYKNCLHLRKYEYNILKRFDKIVTMSETDKEILKSVIPKLDITVIPNGVDTSFYTPVDTPLKPRLTFTAGPKHYANTDAAQYFIKDMWPLIKQKSPDVELYLLGNYPVEEEGDRDLSKKIKDPGIIWTGLIEDIRPLLAGSIFIAPIRIASGTRLKILEAMSMGCAIISTTIGAEGILARQGEEILIVDTPSDFVKSVLELFKNPARRKEIGEKARALVQKKYDWKNILNTQEEFYEKVKTQHG